MITVLADPCYAKAFYDTELWKSCLLGGNGLFNLH